MEEFEGLADEDVAAGDDDEEDEEDGIGESECQSALRAPCLGAHLLPAEGLSGFHP